uniref:DUF3974 domain-containing protein n=1 Tax=Bacteroides stercorirosoris TaxID=871324 RepID=UPI0035225476
MHHEIGQRPVYFLPFLIRQRHFLQALLQFIFFLFVVAQTLFILAQFNKITAVLTVGRKLYISYGKPYVQAYHQCGERFPEESLPFVGRHQADKLSIGEFFYPVIFPVQVR